MTKIHIYMEEQINKTNKLIFILLLLFYSAFSYSSNVYDLYSFELENNRVGISDSITLIVENKHKKDTLLCTDIILYYVDSSGVYEPYLENRELLKYPVPFNDKFKDVKHTFLKIASSSTDKVSFVIQQPYTVEWIDASPNNPRHKKIPIGVLDNEIKLGEFLLEVRFRFSGDNIMKTRSIILSFKREH